MFGIMFVGFFGLVFGLWLFVYFLPLAKTAKLIAQRKALLRQQALHLLENDNETKLTQIRDMLSSLQPHVAADEYSVLEMQSLVVNTRYREVKQTTDTSALGNPQRHASKRKYRALARQYTAAINSFTDITAEISQYHAKLLEKSQLIESTTRQLARVTQTFDMVQARIEDIKGGNIRTNADQLLATAEALLHEAQQLMRNMQYEHAAAKLLVVEQHVGDASAQAEHLLQVKRHSRSNLTKLRNYVAQLHSSTIPAAAKELAKAKRQFAAEDYAYFSKLFTTSTEQLTSLERDLEIVENMVSLDIQGWDAALTKLEVLRQTFKSIQTQFEQISLCTRDIEQRIAKFLSGLVADQQTIEQVWAFILSHIYDMPENIVASMQTSEAQFAQVAAAATGKKIVVLQLSAQRDTVMADIELVQNRAAAAVQVAKQDRTMLANEITAFRKRGEQYSRNLRDAAERQRIMNYTNAWITTIEQGTSRQLQRIILQDAIHALDTIAVERLQLSPLPVS